LIIAIYHCSIRIITRGKGKTAVASAAYISGSKITNEYDGVTHDYRKKKEIIHAEILLPVNAPNEFSDRSLLWNSVEKIEKNRNAQLARTVELALPNELTKEEQISLAKEYCKRNFVDEGMVADLCIHDKNDGNPHVHIMLTVRPFNDDGTWGSKQKKVYELDDNGNKIYDKKKRQYKCRSEPSVDWNNRASAELWRENWANICNEYLEKNNHAETKIDHRSYKRQDIEKIPQIHLGGAVCGLESRGILTGRGERNREIQRQNQEIERLKHRLENLEKWAVKNEPEGEENLIEKLLRFRDNGGKFNQHLDVNLKNFKNAKSLQDISISIAFLQENGISTLADMLDKIKADKLKCNDFIIAYNSKNERLTKFANRVNNSSKPTKSLRKEYDKLSAEIKSDKSIINRFAEGINRMETIKMNLQSLVHFEKQEQIQVRAKSYELE